MYPGDGYVDWVGLSGYNWGPSRPYHVWQSMADIFGHSYTVLTGMTAKPVMIAETTSAEVGGDKGLWITQGLLGDVPSRMPKVRAVVWFHENKEADWRVNSSTGALAGYRQTAASPTYRGVLP
jgi:endoglucanase